MKKDNNKKSNKIINIDAADKSMGRLASEVAKILNNKTYLTLSASNLGELIVEISNINRIKISDKKMNNELIHYTGYPGGIRRKKWRELFDEDPGKLFLEVIYNMIPKNRHRKSLLKKIKFI